MNLRIIAYIFPTQKGDVHMKGALILLTPEQLDILCSENEHVIIGGPYRSSISIMTSKAQLMRDDIYIYYRMNCCITYPITQQVLCHMRYKDKIKIFLIS